MFDERLFGSFRCINNIREILCLLSQVYRVSSEINE